MATRLENVVFDTAQPRELAEFWSALLGWEIVGFPPDEVDVRAPESQGWALDLVFGPFGGVKTVKNRVHLDLASASPQDQLAIIERARGLGARSVDIGQGDVPWEVMADPEGNEFCVLEPREVYMNAGAVAAIVVDGVDAARMGAFWAEATGWSLHPKPAAEVGLNAPNGRGPWLEFQNGHEPKTVQNRVHLDVRPLAGDDQQTEVERLIGHGARRADIGQGDVPWEVMADPEGNEFCVLTPAR
ncbi:putative enzyme related to lactoylglutathione lyase [Kibdelosporangium banguiense]|uniref:Enzyme related to lactoylglutathione lyase n=1 Tax=Kibdelosporangium banguiense TaxID=1365924 RepID=A0ABS4U340_9PSEU|nr:VOC family protein [Kibdelosporangium banguiense]MBP2331082.1 putative enzyme related to lactoylglutathione lyase [Kibdelosporangium banguiense]